MNSVTEFWKKTEDFHDTILSVADETNRYVVYFTLLNNQVEVIASDTVGAWRLILDEETLTAHIESHALQLDTYVAKLR